KLAEETRLAAARDLVSMGTDAGALDTLFEQINPRATPAFTRGLLQALADSTADTVGQALVKSWGELTPSARSAGLSLLLRRPAWTRAVLTGLEKGHIDKNDLSLDQVQLLSHHPDKALAAQAVKLLARGGRLPSPDRQKVLDTFLPLAKLHGDKASGKTVFEKNCAKCHRFGSLGQNIGP